MGLGLSNFWQLNSKRVLLSFCKDAFLLFISLETPDSGCLVLSSKSIDWVGSRLDIDCAIISVATVGKVLGGGGMVLVFFFQVDE